MLETPEVKLALDHSIQYFAQQIINWTVSYFNKFKQIMFNSSGNILKCNFNSSVSCYAHLRNSTSLCFLDCIVFPQFFPAYYEKYNVQKIL